MPDRLRLLLVVAMVVLVAGLTWVIAEHATVGQPLSLAVLVDGGSEALRTLDRVGQVLTQVSAEQEIALGAEIATKVEAGALAAGDLANTQRAYVQAVVDRLVAKGRLRRPEIPYRAEIVDTEMVNAFAIPGGRVYITTGMLAFLRSEAELAAIMGHEMAHVDLKHCIERIQYELVAKQVGGRLVEAMIGAGYALVSIGYADELEAEADRQGVLFAQRAGYHPQAGQVVFARLRAAEGGEARRDSLGAEVGGMVADAFGDYFATHPKSDERLRNFDEVYRRQRIDVTARAYLGRQNYLTWTPMTTSAFPDEYVSRAIYP